MKAGIWVEGDYIWSNRDTALRWHGEAYEAMIANVYGSRPRIQILDAPIRVDPGFGRIEEA